MARATDDVDAAPDEPIRGVGPLVAANVFTLIAALALRWPLDTLMWPYLAQSVIIGWFARRRMLDEPNVTTEGLSSEDGTPTPNTPQSRASAADFFVVHYGFFHAGYLFFVVSRSGWPSAGEALGIAALAIPYAFTHAHSFRANRPAEEGRPVSLGALMFVPYLRIVPMHFTILFGGELVGDASGYPVGLFVVLKTASDVAMHYAEHRLLRR